jgi:hypothetical protein
LAIEEYIRIFRYMKEIFQLIGKLIFIYFIYLAIKEIWNSGIIGKIILLSMLAFGLYTKWETESRVVYDSGYVKLMEIE